MGPHGVARDGHGLQNGVGVALQHRAVHERAGIALVGVAAHILDPVGADRVGGELPLFARGEARAAPAPQAGGQHRVDDLLGRDVFGEDFTQGGVAVHADVLRVDDAAVAQGDAVLVLVEPGLGQGGGRAVAPLVPVEQALDDAALDDVLGDNLLHVVHRHVGVARPLGVDGDDGPQGAQAEAARAHHLGLLVHALGGQLLFKLRDDLGTLGGGAAGAGADQNMGTNQAHLTPSLILPRRWCTRSPRGR